MPLLNTRQAQQELFTDNYRVWATAYPPVNRSNAPVNCNQISIHTAATLRRQWVQAELHNSWNQSAATGYRLSDGQVRWVTRSVSRWNVVDFHARWVNDAGTSFIFLWHFEIVE